MSVCRRNGTKIDLPRSGADSFWSLVQSHYALEDSTAWKYLAVLALRENAGWPLEKIGLVFGHPKGHISRVLSRIKEELRERFSASPEYLDLDWELDSTASEEPAEGQDCSHDLSGCNES